MGMYFKKSHGAWYANIPGAGKNGQPKPKRLGKTEAEAHAKYAELLNPICAPAPAAGPTLAPVGPTLAYLVDRFCDHVVANCPEQTMLAYTRYSRKWATVHGHLPATEIKGLHIMEAADKLYPKVGPKPYSDSARAQHAKVAKRVFAHAANYGYIATDPVAGFKCKIKWGKRDIDLTQEQFDKLCAGCSGPILDLITLLWDTGCRPKEAFEATAKHLDREVKCVRYAKGKGGTPRIVYLTDRAFDILARLADQHPDGALLRNQVGKKWTISSASQRLRVLEAQTGVKATCYTFRHAFVTRHVKAGMNLVSLQNLVGHSSLKMISEVYAHVRGDHKHLGAALRQAG